MRFFFYGIFLARSARESYGITAEPEYATVQDYVTCGHYIVAAYEIPSGTDACLTGILVEVPEDKIEAIDRLEAGYTREIIMTTHGEEAYMYVGK
jgi:gamma-glutamylcyclotransferase (GGCT)/AIG2-like uncharacterized protein YtfP